MKYNSGLTYDASNTLNTYQKLFDVANFSQGGDNIFLLTVIRGTYIEKYIIILSVDSITIEAQNPDEHATTLLFFGNVEGNGNPSIFYNINFSVIYEIDNLTANSYLEVFANFLNLSYFGISEADLINTNYLFQATDISNLTRATIASYKLGNLYLNDLFFFDNNGVKKTLLYQKEGKTKGSTSERNLLILNNSDSGYLFFNIDTSLYNFWNGTIWRETPVQNYSEGTTTYGSWVKNGKSVTLAGTITLTDVTGNITLPFAPVKGWVYFDGTNKITATAGSTTAAVTMPAAGTFDFQKVYISA